MTKLEGDRIGMKIKLIEQSRVSVTALLTRPDLSGCLFPDCKIEEDSCWGANYTGECQDWARLELFLFLSWPHFIGYVSQDFTLGWDCFFKHQLVYK